MKALLDVQGVVKHFGGVKALSDFSCFVQQGEILGIIGPNGAGKTTFFNVVSGFLAPECGEIRFKEYDITGMPLHRVVNLGIGRTFQNLRLVRHISVQDNVLLCFPKQPGEKLSSIFFNWRTCQEHEHKNKKSAMALLTEAGLAEKAYDPAEELSYGQQKLLSLVHKPA